MQVLMVLTMNTLVVQGDKLIVCVWGMTTNISHSPIESLRLY